MYKNVTKAANDLATRYYISLMVLYREILGTRLPYDSVGAQDMPARFLQAIGMNIQIWVVLGLESNRGPQDLKQADKHFTTRLSVLSYILD